MPLKVEQTSATGFGYIVRAAKPGEPADLRAYTIEVPSDAGARLALAIPQDAFRRDVVAVGPRNAPLAFLLALLPALLGAALVLARIAARRRESAEPAG
ncbi:MAG: hypothetical protein U1E14_03910 [Geminicoccaceae bacterium]